MKMKALHDHKTKSEKQELFAVKIIKEKRGNELFSLRIHNTNENQQRLLQTV